MKKKTSNSCVENHHFEIGDKVWYIDNNGQRARGKITEIEDYLICLNSIKVSTKKRIYRISNSRSDFSPDTIFGSLADLKIAVINDQANNYSEKPIDFKFDHKISDLDLGDEVNCMYDGKVQKVRITKIRVFKTLFGLIKYELLDASNGNVNIYDLHREEVFRTKDELLDEHIK